MGTLERESEDGRSADEFVQSLCLRRGGGLDLSLRGGCGYDADGFGLPYGGAPSGVRCAVVSAGVHVQVIVRGDQVGLDGEREHGGMERDPAGEYDGAAGGEG